MKFYIHISSLGLCRVNGDRGCVYSSDSVSALREKNGILAGPTSDVKHAPRFQFSLLCQFNEHWLGPSDIPLRSGSIGVVPIARFPVPAQLTYRRKLFHRGFKYFEKVDRDDLSFQSTS